MNWFFLNVFFYLSSFFTFFLHLRTASRESRSVVEKATTQAWAPLQYKHFIREAAKKPGIFWGARKRCARKELYLLFDLFKACY